MSALSVCLVPNVHWTRSQQLRAICNFVIDFTNNLSDTLGRCKELLKQNGFSVSQSLVLCLRNDFDISIKANNKPCAKSKEVLYASAASTMLHTTDGMVFYSSLRSSIYWNNSLMHWNEILNLLRCKEERVLEAVSGFNYPFSSSLKTMNCTFCLWVFLLSQA